MKGEVNMTKAVRNDINTFTENLILAQLTEDKFFEDKVCNEKDLILHVAKRSNEVINKVYQDFLLNKTNVFNKEAIKEMRTTMAENPYA